MYYDKWNISTHIFDYKSGFFQQWYLNFMSGVWENKFDHKQYECQETTHVTGRLKLSEFQVCQNLMHFPYSVVAS